MGKPTDEGGRRAPKAWALLAVTLALMALVAAVSTASRPAKSRHPSAGNALPTSPPGGTDPLEPGTTKPPPSSGSPRTNPQAAEGAGGTAAAASTGPGVGDGGPESASPPVAPTSSGTPTQPVTTGTAAPAESTVGPVPGTVAPLAATSTTVAVSPPYPGPGNIVWPTVSASFAAPGGGAVTAGVSWTGGETLELMVACPAGPSATRAGPSPLSVSLSDVGGGGTCTVTLALVSATVADPPVSYTLSIRPAPAP